MIEFNDLGILKLSFTEKDLPGNGKCGAARESLEISGWNYWHISRIIPVPQRMRDKNIILFGIWQFPSQEQYYLFGYFFHVDQERGEEAWAGNCPWFVCSFSVLAKAESSGASPSNLPSEGCPFPSWLEVTLPLPTLSKLSQMAGLVMAAWL